MCIHIYIYIYIYIHTYIHTTSMSLVRAVCSVKDHNLLNSWPLLKNTSIRQVALDKWLPLKYGPVPSHLLTPMRAAHARFP